MFSSSRFPRSREFHRKRSGWPFSMRKLFKYYPIHEIALSLGPQKSLALAVFHALTGCDAVSFFAGKSKKSALDTWNGVIQTKHLNFKENQANQPGKPLK